MTADFHPGGAPVAVVACGLSALVTWLAIHYARRHRLIDQPGQRRSHAAPTPRGGGVGIVVASAVALAVALAIAPVPFERRLAGGLLVGMLVVALAGWIDDHRPLAVLPRLAAHVLAAAMLAGLLLPLDLLQASALAGVVAATVVLTTVWSINLHNFMDGIDGLLATQALFAFLTFAAIAHGADGGTLSALPLAFAAAVAGFLPFNAPRARIFMGDVGSGALGFLVAAAAWLGVLHGNLRASAALLVVSVFAVDAGCTLLSRMVRGRRWYSAHREHLYQWLVRRGHSHARVSAFYLVWNMLVILPPVYWLQGSPRPSPQAATAVVACVYGLAVAAWIAGKQACLRRGSRRRVRHAA